MANNYTQFSVIVPFPENMALYDMWASKRVKDETETEDDAEYDNDEGRVDWRRDSAGLWVVSEEGGSVEAAAYLIQAYLCATKQSIVVFMSWANTCSKPRVNEFDGGGVVITQTEMFWVNAYDAINKATEAGVDTSTIVGA